MLIIEVNGERFSGLLARLVFASSMAFGDFPITRKLSLLLASFFDFFFILDKDAVLLEEVDTFEFLAG